MEIQRSTIEWGQAWLEAVWIAYRHLEVCGDYLQYKDGSKLEEGDFRDVSQLTLNVGGKPFFFIHPYQALLALIANVEGYLIEPEDRDRLVIHKNGFRFSTSAYHPHDITAEDFDLHGWKRFVAACHAYESPFSWGRKRASSTDLSLYPHKCRCGSPAYIGFSTIECSAGCEFPASEGC